MKGILFICTLALLLYGCCTTSTSAIDGRNTVIVKNTCCKLLGFIPIVSGDPDYPNQDVNRWFENTMTMETNVKLLDRVMKKQGANGYQFIHSYQTDEALCLLFLKRYTLVTSAELTR